MLSLPSAVETLERNSPSGLLESVLEEESFSTSARYFFASVLSPDLIDDIRLVSALSKLLWLRLLEELEADDVEDDESSANRVLLLCKLEINMDVDPSRLDFSANTRGKPSLPRDTPMDACQIADITRGGARTICRFHFAPEKQICPRMGHAAKAGVCGFTLPQKRCGPRPCWMRPAMFLCPLARAFSLLL